MNITLKQIAKAFGCKIEDVSIVEINQKQLSEFKKGDVVTIGDREWIVFDHLENGTTQIVSKNFVTEKVVFSEDNNNYANSSIRKWLNQEFYTELQKVVGTEAVVKHTVDLTSVDGRKTYGSVEDFVSMPTFDFIRANIDVLDNFKECINDWQWTVTPWTNFSKKNSYGVCCLLPVGLMLNGRCDYHCGVRAFCTLKSSIFVSC